MEHETGYQEFLAAFWIYVRSEDEMNGWVDGREASVRELLKLPVEHALLMEPHDLAALLSCCVTARPRYGVLAEQFVNVAAERFVTVLRDRGQLPLVAKTRHPVGRLLAEMLESTSGRECYHAVALCLSQARDDRKVRSHLCLEKAATVEPLPSFADLEQALADAGEGEDETDVEDDDE